MTLGSRRAIRVMAGLYSRIKVRLASPANRSAIRVSVGQSLIRGRVRLNVSGENNTLDIADGCILNGLSVTMRGSNNHIRIDHGVRSGGYLHLWADEGSRIEIGAASTFESAHIAATEATSVLIGRDVMVATDVEIRSGDSHSILDADGMRLNPAEDVVIDDHVWLAARVTLLKGSVLPQGTIVGAGSIVSGGPPNPQTLIAGVPARTIKQGVSWSRERVRTSNTGGGLSG